MATDPHQILEQDADAGVSASVWRYARASRAAVVVDAAAYFGVIQEAMLRARQRIVLLGWDFDTRVQLSGGRRWYHLPHRARYPARLGGFVVWLVRRRAGLGVHVLNWNFGALNFLRRGSMVLDLIRWAWNRRIWYRLDSAHPLGCSHHQKIVVIDDRLAACGGIDVTSSRWDTPAHIEKDPRRSESGGKPGEPWHDLALVVEGEAAAALGDLARDRWVRAGGAPLAACATSSVSAWPSVLRADFVDVEIGIARTRAAWGDASEIREIEALYVEHIGRAQRFIYAETQYFASTRIAEALAARLMAADPPEVVLVVAHHSHGWLQQTAMDNARVRLRHALAACDPAGRLRAFTPLARGGTPIYVHSKLMVVDDEVLRIGSANMNNRSMGLDSECDLFLDARRPGNGHIGPAIAALRHRLIAEHCGKSFEQVVTGLARAGSMARYVDSLPAIGRRLVPFSLRPLTNREKALADSALLDPDRAEDIFEPMSKRQGLFRRAGLLHAPDEGENKDVL